MKNKTLVIENVNFEQLEEDREAIHNLLMVMELGTDHTKALENVVAMLDHWSDKLYHANLNKE